MKTTITETFKNAAPKWYTGKALASLLALLPALAESETQGFWVPGVSRKLTAALNKLSTATKKIAKQARAYYDSAQDRETVYGTVAFEKARAERNAWNDIYYAMYYCSSAHALDKVLPAVKHIEEHGEPATEQKTVLRFAREFSADLLPVQNLIHHLDSTRPKPVFTSLGLSPTVTATLTEQLKLNVATVRFPEFRDLWKEREINGKLVRVCITIIVWPKGTMHGKSRFSGKSQCNACGHAIRNNMNWVPFLMDDAKGVPHSFWVGRDCAKNIFNVDVKGDAEYMDGGIAALAGETSEMVS